jgi:hypothetical protein
MSISAANRREFEETQPYDVRRMADGNVYASEKLNEAREWIYEQDNKYPRRADTKSTIALVISVVALIASCWPAIKGVFLLFTAKP